MCGAQPDKRKCDREPYTPDPFSSQRICALVRVPFAKERKQGDLARGDVLRRWVRWHIASAVLLLDKSLVALPVRAASG